MKKSTALKNSATIETSGLHVVKEPTKAPRVKKEKPEIDPHTLGVVEQVKVVFSKKHRIAACIGFLGGAWVPTAAYVSLHLEYSHTIPFYQQISFYVAALCLTFSLPKVTVWGTKAFGNTIFGFSFAALTEIIMVCSNTTALAAVGLALLVCINGISAATWFAYPKKKLTDLYT